MCPPEQQTDGPSRELLSWTNDLSLLKFVHDSANLARHCSDGSLDTVNVSPAPFLKEGVPLEQLTSTEMALYRMIVSFADDGTPQALVGFGQGTSGDPDSPHFSDQRQAWADAEYKALPFRRANVDAQATDRITLTGGGKYPGAPAKRGVLKV